MNNQSLTTRARLVRATKADLLDAFLTISGSEHYYCEHCYTSEEGLEVLFGIYDGKHLMKDLQADHLVLLQQATDSFNRVFASRFIAFAEPCEACIVVYLMDLYQLFQCKRFLEIARTAVQPESQLAAMLAEKYWVFPDENA